MFEQPGFYNADCMEAMKEFPDNFFDLAIVDPPYGAGFTEGGGCKGWFSKYHQNAENIGGVEQDITHSERGKNKALTRTGGTWASKYAKKLLRGTSPRDRNTLKSCFVSHVTRLYGGGQLLSTSTDKVLCCLAKAEHQRIVQHGDGGIRLDELQRQCKGV